MGAESSDWYNNYCLVGFSDTRGKAWHYRKSDQGAEPNHYSGAIPVDDVLRRLFNWQAVSGEVKLTYPNPNYDPSIPVGSSNSPDVTIVDPTRQAIIRPDTQSVFGIFKETYTIHQHDEWLINTASQILDTSSGDIGIANAVLLRGGAVAAVQFEMPESIKFSHLDGIEIRPSLLAAGSLDGSLSSTYLRTAVNVVCDNTMSAAMTNYLASRLKIRHSKYSKLRIGEARDALDIVFEIAQEFEQEVTALLNIPVKGLQFKQYLDFVAPLPDPVTHLLPNLKHSPHLGKLAGKPASNKYITATETRRDTYLDLWINDPRVAPWAGNAYGILQMNNTYNHHFVGTNGDTVRGERNMFNAASGAFAKSDAEALDTLFDKVLVTV